MITEKSNRLQVIMITDNDYPISAGDVIHTQVSLKYFLANVDVSKCHCSASLATCIYSRVTVVPHSDDKQTQE